MARRKWGDDDPPSRGVHLEFGFLLVVYSIGAGSLVYAVASSGLFK